MSDFVLDLSRLQAIWEKKTCMLEIIHEWHKASGAEWERPKMQAAFEKKQIIYNSGGLPWC